MDTNRIMNEIDNAENEQELEEAVALIVHDITAQVFATHTAITDNPSVDKVTLEALVKRVADSVQGEYLAPGSVLD